jgi:polyisoprenoid-binding protein YceI
MAATAGHDLTIEASRWSGVLTVGDDLVPSALDVRIDLNALIVRKGTGGLKPLTDRDRREIGATARKLLRTAQYPEAVYTATGFRAAASGGWEAEGTLTLAGSSQPLRLSVRPAGPGRFQAQGTVLQSAYGIKPYTAFFGALKVRDAVGVEATVDLTGREGGPG